MDSQLQGYLLVGYWFAESEAYDITWTTPYCIMTLRFTGLVMDVYDGAHFVSSLLRMSSLFDLDGLVFPVTAAACFSSYHFTL